jgi:PAS domain S-box-containing protein
MSRGGDDRSAQARFDMLFTHNLDGVFFMTLDEPLVWNDSVDKDAALDYAFDHLRITDVNPAMCAQLGVPRAQLLGTVPRDRWSRGPGPWREYMRILYDAGRAFHPTRAPRPDGTWYDVEGEYVCLYDEAGRITGHLGTQRDVTEARRTAERLELALAGGDMGVWDMEVDTGETYVDPAWITRLGYSPDDPALARGDWWSSRIHPEDQASSTRAFLAHLAGETPRYHTELRMRTASGGWAWVLVLGRAARRDPARGPRIVGTMIDITERRALQERLAASERMASLGALAAGVGHEINNPLTYIVLNLVLLERDLARLEPSAPPAIHERMRTKLQQLRYGADRVSSVVRDLQTLSRGQDPRIASVEVVGVIERCLEIAAHRVRHHAHVVRELAAVPRVRGSEDRLVQLFLNLIVNAAQSIPEGAASAHAIRVTTRTGPGGEVVIEIADDGAGIPPELRDKIFEPFFTTKEVGEGTGLGLAICRSIVAGMNGALEVDSEVGRGSTFRVILPAEPSAVVDEHVPATATTAPANGRVRVLVVDDEPIVGYLVAQLLEEHDVVSDTSARAALDRLGAGERFDRIICDVMMPEVTGIDFYEQLGHLAPELQPRVVFLSGGVFSLRAQEFFAGVPNALVDKPFHPEELLRALAIGE